VTHTLESLHRQVRHYTSQHPELAAAHHCDFGMLLTERVEYYTIGLTPGETDQEREIHPGVGHFNPHDPSSWSELPRNSKRWITMCKTLLGTDSLMLGDAFFWSVPSMKSFRSRFAEDLKNSRHLPFCMTMTKALLELYPPRAVVALGLGNADTLATLFQLRPIAELDVGRWNLRHLDDGIRPWFVVAHPSYWPSRDEWKKAGQYIAHHSLDATH
jgi:hypothetical protein